MNKINKTNESRVTRIHINIHMFIHILKMDDKPNKKRSRMAARRKGKNGKYAA